MTPQQVVALGVRLFAVWLGLANIGLFFGALLTPLSSGGRLYMVYATLSEILMVVAAILLWIFPLSVAHKIVPRTKFENTIDIGAVESARVGCALVGLLTLANSVPAFFRLGAMAIVASGPSSAVSAWTADQKILVATIFVQLAVALGLIFWSSGFARLILKPSSASGDGSV